MEFQELVKFMGGFFVPVQSKICILFVCNVNIAKTTTLSMKFMELKTVFCWFQLPGKSRILPQGEDRRKTPNVQKSPTLPGYGLGWFLKYIFIDFLVSWWRGEALFPPAELRHSTTNKKPKHQTNYNKLSNTIQWVFWKPLAPPVEFVGHRRCLWWTHLSVGSPCPPPLRFSLCSLRQVRRRRGHRCSRSPPPVVCLPLLTCPFFPLAEFRHSTTNVLQRQAGLMTRFVVPSFQVIN